MNIKLTSLITVCNLILSGSAFAATHVITQKDKKFDKTEIEIKKGDAIKFVNDDSVTHHLMYKVEGKKKSNKQKKGDPDGTAIEQTFPVEEDVTVRCAIHPKMKLKVKVK